MMLGAMDRHELAKRLSIAEIEIERLRAIISEIGSATDGYMEGAGEPEFGVYSWISGLCHKTLAFSQ
jgi:hypothetical protein